MEQSTWKCCHSSDG